MIHLHFVLSLTSVLLISANVFAADCSSLFGLSPKTAIAEMPTSFGKLTNKLIKRLSPDDKKDYIASVALLVRRDALPNFVKTFNAEGPKTYAGDFALLVPPRVEKAVLLKMIEEEAVLKATIETSAFDDRLRLLPRNAMVEGVIVHIDSRETNAETAKQNLESYGAVIQVSTDHALRVHIPAGSLIKLGVQIRFPGFSGVSMW